MKIQSMVPIALYIRHVEATVQILLTRNPLMWPLLFLVKSRFLGTAGMRSIPAQSGLVSGQSLSDDWSLKLHFDVIH